MRTTTKSRRRTGRREGKGGRMHAALRCPSSPPLCSPPYDWSRRFLPPSRVPGYQKASVSAAGLPPGQDRSQLHRQEQQSQQQGGRRRRPCSGAARAHVPPPPECLPWFLAGGVCRRSCGCWTPPLLLIGGCFFFAWMGEIV